MINLMNMVKKRVSVVLWNIALFIALLLCVEMALGYWFGPVPREAGVTCFDPVTHHKYCHGVHQLRRMANSDGGATVSTFVSSSGIVVPSASEMDKPFNISDYKVIMIGDSFMQAEEMSFEKRLGSLIEKELGAPALLHGYSSWAPAIQTNWLLSQKFNASQTVLYFIMVNDFTPAYGNSNLHYHKEAKATVNPEGFKVLRFKQSRPDEASSAAQVDFAQSVVNRSFFASGLKSLGNSRHLDQEGGTEGLISRSFVKPYPSCQAFHDSEVVNSSKNLLIYDYLVFSQNVECWPSEHKQEVLSGIEDIKRAKKYLDKTGTQLHVLLIPPGWAFPNENLIGKSARGYFNLSQDSLVSQRGLASYLSKNLASEGVSFTDLEPVISTLKRDSSDAFYFPVDGHWTEKGHEAIANYLIKESIVK